ncbi:MAG: hypothetical protein OXG72_02725 [Acidobacteria bacterium]|nr:hypothetical protein [Acidobacteriota bacterium]
MRTLPPMPNPQPAPRNHDVQLPLDLQDRAPRFAPDPDDWTREAEPVPDQPLDGDQPELFPRTPAENPQA